MKKRNQYTAEFKTKVVLEVLREEGTLNEIVARYEISPVTLGRWKIEFLERAPEKVPQLQIRSWKLKESELRD